MKKRVLFVFGTRPEAIKMAPIIKEFQKHPEAFILKVCVTGQHKEMLQQVMDFFGLVADFNLSLMQHNQTLFDITANVLKGIEGVLNQYEADYLFVQGDTTTAMAGALAGYYKKIKVCHVEAGLRSGDIFSPFPEEVNRRIVSTLCSYHFAPTQMAKENLTKENYTDNIFITGNTVIDALLWGVEKVREDTAISQQFSFLSDKQKIILVTAHRRESFGEPFRHICNALKEIAIANPEFNIVYPVHLNPNVQQVVYETLQDQPNIHLIKPLDYPSLIWLMDKSRFVLTDSGGIQEEAPSLGKPVLVLRNVTERQEGITAGTALLVGTDKKLIISEVQKLIDDESHYTTMAKAVNPYGNGTAAKKITSILLNT
ncbi:MAG: UDP-N-acetylglucosamine 2-epimerase (non-hydrolyzing) [Chitinophagaceae bacterium]|nr:MAG: UDP-N-acetylglucosamine 2-epimerase (non-hydrolyzing) [Chitinophagaceae bacterium]